MRLTHSMMTAAVYIRNRCSAAVGIVLQIITLALCLAAPVSSQTTGSVIQFGTVQMFDSDGDPCAACTMEFYAAGTSTPITVYTTSALAVAASNPYTLDSSGRGTIWVGTAAYKVIYKTAAGVTIWTLDNIPGATGGGAALAVSSVSGNTTLALTDALVLANCTCTITLPTAVGNTGKVYTVKSTGSGTVTLDPNGAQTIDGSSTRTMATQHGAVQFASDGSNWRILNDVVDVQDSVLTRPELKDYFETMTSPAISSNTLTLNIDNGNTFVVALDANVTTLTISGAPATGKVGAFTLIVTFPDNTARTITWGSSVKWAFNVTPTLTCTTNERDIFTFLTVDGGTTWFAAPFGQNFQIT